MKLQLISVACMAAMACSSLSFADKPEKAQQDRARPAAEKAAEGKRHHESRAEEMAAWLALSQHAQIELGKFAMERAHNEPVRDFAEKMAKEHYEYLNELRDFMPEVNLSDESDKAEREKPAARRAEESKRQDKKAHTASRAHGPMMEVGVKMNRYKLTLTKEMLEGYEGQDFDMGYLGQQIVDHINLLATLHAMDGYGPPEFQEVVEKGIRNAEAHLKQATVLAAKLEDKEQGFKKNR